MELIRITVNGDIFSCRANCTVEQAVISIRSRYGLQFGGLVSEDGAYLLQGDLISDAVGAISFTGGQPIQQGVKLILTTPFILFCRTCPFFCLSHYVCTPFFCLFPYVCTPSHLNIFLDACIYLYYIFSPLFHCYFV